MAFPLSSFLSIRSSALSVTTNWVLLGVSTHRHTAGKEGGEKYLSSSEKSSYVSWTDTQLHVHRHLIHYLRMFIKCPLPSGQSAITLNKLTNTSQQQWWTLCKSTQKSWSSNHMIELQPDPNQRRPWKLFKYSVVKWFNKPHTLTI